MKTKQAPAGTIRRPFVLLNLAMTADGKISFRHDRFQPFGTDHDREMLLRLRATADAVMAGARTIEASPVTLGPGGAKYRRQRCRRGLAEYNLRVVVSGSGTIRPDAEIFRHHFSPIIILTSRRADPGRLKRLRALGAHVEVCGEAALDLRLALQRLREKWRVRRLLCEGGGELNAALFRAGLVDEVHLTICPLILGGRTAPTLADGPDSARLADAIGLELKSARRVGQELYLVFSADQLRRFKSRFSGLKSESTRSP